MAALGTIALIAGLAGSAVSAVGTIASGQAAAEIGQQQALISRQQGEAAQKAANFEAAQLEIQGKEEKALAQREMLQLRRQKRLTLSQLQGRAAASGFSATDPTSLALADEIERYGTYQEQLALYGGTAKEKKN